MAIRSIICLGFTSRIPFIKYYRNIFLLLYWWCGKSIWLPTKSLELLVKSVFNPSKRK
jgi:hypothetical protein